LGAIPRQRPILPTCESAVDGRGYCNNAYWRCCRHQLGMAYLDCAAFEIFGDIIIISRRLVKHFE
jgi:hypothetical protein